MSTGITKPKWHELQHDLTAIAEIPERVQEINIVRLKELLIYIENEIQNRISRADAMAQANFGKYPYPKEYLPKRELDYWLERGYQFGLNYYNLKDLRSIISKQLNAKIVFNSNIFKNAPSQRFFEFLFHKFIKTDRTPKTAVQYVFRQFYDLGKSIDLVEMDYKIKEGKMRGFAEYYNSFIVDKVPKEKLKDFEITFNLNEPKIKSLYLIGNKEKRKEKFNSHLLEFQRNNITVG